MIGTDPLQKPSCAGQCSETSHDKQQWNFSKPQVRVAAVTADARLDCVTLERP